MLGLPADQDGHHFANDTRTRLNWETMVTGLQSHFGDMVILQVQNIFDTAAS
jgi:hypothetical protein